MSRDKEKVFAHLFDNSLYMFFAAWDVEGTGRYIRRYREQSFFKYVWPAAHDDISKGTPIHRDAFRYPVRRLLDLSYYLLHSLANGDFPSKRVSMKDQAKFFDRDENTLRHWRSGGVNLSARDFYSICRAMAGEHKNFDLAWPYFFQLYYAAVFFQENFTDVGGGREEGRRWIYLALELYDYWWSYYHDKFAGEILEQPGSKTLPGYFSKI